ncbi:MAG: c-type cytochrome domain-containing protein [Bythopirellula sp.]
MLRITRRNTLLTTALLALLSAQNSAAAKVDFAEQIQPIFKKNCSGCHGEKKGLGGLRLHTPEGIQKKWKKDEHLIVKGNPDESELYERLLLPADHKKFMPKKGKPLPEEKLNLIRQWIEQGAAFTVTAEVKPQADADAAPEQAPKIEDLPLPEVEAADPEAIKQLAETGAQVTALFAGSPLLQVSFALRGDPATDNDLAPLAAVAPQIHSLNLAKAQISDQGLTVVAQLKNLSKLHLENSSVTDSGLTHLSGLSRLQYLNLYGTQITDVGLQHVQSLAHLQKLYVWQTKVSYDAAQAMEKAQAGLVIDLGFDHPVVKRKRLTKQLKQAQEATKESEAEFEKAKAAFDRAKQDQDKSKQRAEELQKELDKLDGKVEPEKTAEKPKDDQAKEEADKPKEEKPKEEKANDDTKV